MHTCKVLGKKCRAYEYRKDLYVVLNRKVILSRYLRDTKKGCEKDPLFAEGRDLTTHAIHMISSKSRNDCISGVEMLYTSICMLEREMNDPLVKDREVKFRETGMPYLLQVSIEMKQLVSAATSSGKVLQKLLEMLDPKGLHGRETRKYAAKIVECLASDINLEQFPRGIHYISSLIGTLQEYSVALAHPFQPGWDFRGELEEDYKELLLRGLCIIRELASSENNCRVIRDTQDLVSKIMAPITSDLLHHTIDDHGEWSDIVEKPVEVMSELTGGPGETGAKLRHDISRCEEAISTLRRILSCNKCNEKLQQRAIQILTRLYVDTTEGSKAADSVLNKESSSREDFIRMLVVIFTSDDKYSCFIRGCAGGALPEICSRGGISNAMQTRGDIVDCLTEVLVHDKSNICRQEAAEILSNLCSHCMDLSTPSSHVLPSSPMAEPSVFVSTTLTPPLISPSPPSKDDDLGKIKRAILKVLGEILHCGDGTGEGKKVDQERFAKPKTDIESQYENGRGNGISSSTSSHPQNNEHEKEENESATSTTFLSSLIFLSGTLYNTTFMGDLPPHLDASSFLNMLKEVLVKKSDHDTVENLLLLKAIANMMIVMMKHSGDRSIKQEDLQSLLEALSGAWRKILNLDYSMIFSYGSSSATTSSKLDRCTLASLLKEAQELHAKMPSTSVDVSSRLSVILIRS